MVNGALWETAVVLSSTLLAAYGTGYAIGTGVVAPFVRTYAPGLYDAIGGTIGTVVETLSVSWSGGPDLAAQAQIFSAPIFQSTPQQISAIGDYGGDYGAADAWRAFENGGLGCLSGCPSYVEK
jgi:hypothetical protein